MRKLILFTRKAAHTPPLGRGNTVSVPRSSVCHRSTTPVTELDPSAVKDVGPHDPLKVRREDAGASDTTVSDSSAHGTDAAFGDSELRDAHTPTNPSIFVDAGLDADVGEDAAPPDATETNKSTTRGAVRTTRFFALLPFKTLAEECRKTVVPMYKHSTQKNHRHVLDTHLIPWFGDRAMHEITRQEVQGYVAHLVRQQYAPRSIDHIHDVLSAVLRTAVKWGHLPANPAREIDLPKLRNVRPKWAMSVADAKALVDALPLLPKTMVALALLTGLRRGELFALRWRGLDELQGSLVVREAVYEGQFDNV